MSREEDPDEEYISGEEEDYYEGEEEECDLEDPLEDEDEDEYGDEDEDRGTDRQDTEDEEGEEDEEDGGDNERKDDWEGTLLRTTAAAAASSRSARPAEPPGPTPYAASLASKDVESAFRLLFTQSLERLILEMTNLAATTAQGTAGGGKWTRYTCARTWACCSCPECTGLAVPQAGRGLAVFRATMPLKAFHASSSLLCFDARETRAARRAARDKLAATRALWDRWSARLPYLYNPRPDVTVDEQLSPSKYGIKLWVACDARSSYAWNMQVYTGKPSDRARPGFFREERELTEGLRGPRGGTCDNFFTSYGLALGFLDRRNLTLVGTVRKNKPELPAGGALLRDRLPSGPAIALLSHVPKKNRNVLILSTLHADPRDVAQVGGDRGDRKPDFVLHYNKTKGGVDNLDKLVATYSCRRTTAHWPLALFHNVLDVSAYNAFVIWRELNPGSTAAAAEAEAQRESAVGEDPPPRIPGPEPAPEPAPAPAPRQAPPRRGAAALPASKRKRCQICPKKKDSKTHAVCRGCSRYICRSCALPAVPPAPRVWVTPAGQGDP
ncbi:piggyBac transposable element-derived protein 4-like [Siniperca chuatsi]|uniref:piggyBac transposable element-derived protein 4-like n=1 Tax=Siniperca chuatsi TaxID=119488 RepID=UPI001CE1B6BE|nr:piggyBac transposable element-derived protein 4-like [Siniperca chuatsi]